MALEAINHAHEFIQKWDKRDPPYELPNGEVITETRDSIFCLTLRGQEHSLIVDEIDNIITLARTPTQEVFIGYDLFFIFEKVGWLSWQFRTIDVDGSEEIHSYGRYHKVKTEAQTYLNQYSNLSKFTPVPEYESAEP